MLYNRICPHCGQKYYVCKNCEKINSWKSFCCSQECYRQAVLNNELAIYGIKGENPMKYVLRAGMNNGKTISISGYDLELGKFDCSDNTTKTFDDFDYFIVPRDEMKELSERFSKLVENQKVSTKKKKLDGTVENSKGEDSNA